MAKKNGKTKEVSLFKLNLGSGPKNVEGFIACDKEKHPNVKYVFNLGKDKWPFKNNSVDAAIAHHVIEHLTNWNGKFERVHFFNELYRVLKPDAVCEIVCPDWSSDRFWGDPTHMEPFGSMSTQYLRKEWRKEQAPTVDYEITPGRQSFKCDFEVSYGFTLNPSLTGRNQEYIQHAHTYDINARMDFVGQFKKKAPTK